MADFFISYNSANVQRAEWIAWTLRDAGYSLRFAKWECAAGTDIAQWMAHALDDCKRMICVSSPDYLKPKAKYSALERAAMLWSDIDGSERKLVFVKITECQLPLIFSPRSYISFAGLGREEAKQLLLEQLRDPTIPVSEPEFGETWADLNPGPEPEFELPAKSSWPKIAPLDIRAERHVVGREDEVAQLRSALREGGATAITQGAAVVKSSGGMGKSTLARHFAETYGNEYYGLWWLPAENRQLLINELCKLADLLGVPADAPPEERASAALQRVAQDTQPWLLIYDNAIAPKPLENLIPRRDHVHVIVTTREGGWPDKKFRLHEIGELDFSTEDSPATTLLMQEAKRAADPAGARALAEALGGLPLALDNAGAYLRDAPDVSFVGYAENVERAIAQAPPEGGDYPDSVFGAVSLSLERLSPEATQIANILTFWAPEGLEPGVFKPIAKQSSDHEGSKLIPDDLWPVLRAEGAVSQTFAELARRSILERRGKGETANFVMHRLTGAVIRAWLQSEARARWHEAAASVLAVAYPRGTAPADRETWPLCAALTPHVQALAGHGADSAAADYLYNQAAIYLGQMRQDLPALLLARASLRVTKKLHEDDPLHRNVGTGYTTLGARWRNIDRPVIAEKLLARAVEIAEQNPEIGDEDRAAAFSNHGGALKERGGRAQAAGKAAEAADWFRHAARRHQQALLLARRRGDRRLMAACLNNLGTLREAQGRRAAAIRLGRMVVKIHREVLTQDDPSLASSLHNLAGRLLQTPNWREAEPLLDEALTINEDAFAAYPGHPNRVNAAHSLATAAMMRGDRAKAEAIVARYRDDLDLGKLERGALNHHLQIKAVSGEVAPEALKEILNLMGLTVDDARRILPKLFQPPGPT